jgi:hypothetical protein
MPDDQIDTAGAVAAYLNPNVGQPAMAAKAAMQVAAGSNPDFEAELRRVAERTGVPLESARAYPEEVKRQAALQQHDFDQLAQQFPSTTRFLSDPDNARIAHDDISNMSSTEATIGPIRGPKPTFWTYATGLLKSLPQGAGMAREGIRMQLADLFGQDAVREDAQRKYSQLSLEQQVATPEFESSTAQGVYGGVTSTIRAVPGLLASLATRSPTPMLATIGVQTEADAYGKYRVRGATPGQALVGGAAEGAVEVGTELLPMSFLVKNLGKTGAGHFITGLLAREIPGEQIATIAQDAIDTAIANPDKTWGEYLRERPGAAYQTLLATITQAGMMEGANVAMQRVNGRAQEAQHAGQVGEALSQFNALAEASKVRERDADTAQAFFQSLMQEGRDHVWITPKALAESGMLEQMSQALPDVAAQLEQAATTGADIRIPVADLVAKLAGPELEQSIIPHLSEEPGGFTKTTAEQYLASGAAQELAEEVARTLADKPHSDAFNASRDAITTEFQRQLDAAGRFAPTVNQAYATMVGNFYAVQAARLGITPEEMATRYPLQVKAEAMPGLKTLDQPGVDSFNNLGSGFTVEGGKLLRRGEQVGELKLEIEQPAKGEPHLVVRDIKVTSKGNGTGTMALAAIMGKATQYNLPVALTTEAMLGKDHQKRLRAFYERLGFKKNKGADKVKGVTEEYVWTPPNTMNQDAKAVPHSAVQQRLQDILYSEHKTLLDDAGRLAVDPNDVEVEQQLTDDEFEQRSNGEWMDSVAVPLNEEDAQRVIEKVNEMTWYHGSRDTGIDGLDLLSNGALFLTSGKEVAEHYGGPGGRVYEQDVTVRRPLFIASTDLTADMENSGEIEKLQALGYDSIIPLDYGDLVVLSPQVLVANGNTLAQGEETRRGMMSFGDDITAQPTVITLLKNADLSTFLHESGHFFLEVLNDMASRPDAPADIADDMAKVLQWFGIEGATPAPAEGMVRLYHGGEPGDATGPLYFSTQQSYAQGYADKSGAGLWYVDVPEDQYNQLAGGDKEFGVLPSPNVELPADLSTQRRRLVTDSRTALEVWNSMDLEAKRPHHEAFARGFEAYLFEGRAPSTELTGLFSRFRSWLVNVYKSLTALQVDLSKEVRGVFDRMLASSEAIAQAERDQALAGMFGTRPEFMTDEEWTAYRMLSVKATEEATRDLETRSIKDMKWLANAKSKVLRELQKDAAFKRQQVEAEVRREVMVEPVYQAWQFLTLRGSDSTRAWPTPEFKLDPKHVDTRIDNLFVAIAKFGGLDRNEVKTKWGVDHREMPDSGVFGKPILRKTGGLTIERMAEKLVEEHYLDAHDLAEFEDKFDRQRIGQDQYSWEHQWTNGERAPVEPLGDSNYHGKLHTPTLRYMFGEDSPVVQQLIKARMTATDGGLDPDVVAEMLGGFQSGREMVDQLVAVPSPSNMINQLTDQRMLERYGDLTSEEAVDRAVNEALHQKAHIRFLQTEMAALAKAAGKPAVLAKAAQAYAEQIVARTPIAQLRPDKYTSAAKRAGRAADKAFKAGDIQTAAAEKQAQLINMYAAKAALDARNQVEKTMVRFKTITNGSNDKVAKTRDLDMVMATRAILAEFGVGTRGAKATEYLAKVQEYDPAMAAVLRERIDAAVENAKPIKELTIEQLGALRDEVESLWFLAKRSRQMEVDGDLLDRQDIQDQLVARLEEIGVPAEVPGAEHAITPGEVTLSKLQSLRASLRRVEAWAGAKDGANEMGPFRRFIWNTIKDNADAYRADKAKYLKRYRELLDSIAPTLQPVKIAAPELGYTFGYDRGGMGKVELLHAILHTGNAGNKKKLLLGRKWADVQPDGSIDTGRWDAFVARMIKEGTLTRADFDFAQGVWDLLEEMKPAAQKAHRDVFGRYFDEVTADPFKVNLGGKEVEYRGGYVPAIADSRIVSDAKTRAIMEDEAATLMNALPSTSKGFTKGRVEYNRPLLLDLRLLTQHIDKVLLFSHLEQPVRDVRRILGHDSVAKPLHLVDPAAYDGLLIPWLNRTARQQVETKVDGSNGLMRFFSVVRQRAGMAAMFANVSNTVQQITGFSMAALKVKPSHLMGAAVDFIRDPKATAQAVAAASPYMANRMDNEVEAMTGAINDILLNPNVYERAVGWTTKHTYFLQSAFDNVMGPIIWQGAYNQALETAPADLTDDELQLYARRLADSAVRETQGSTLPEDISRIETGNAFVRMFTQFAGYFNMQANLLGTEFAKVAQETGLRKGAGRGFYILLLGFLVPAWGAQAIALAFRGGPDDEDKDGNYLDDWLAQTFGWGTLRAATALVPVVGQTANSLANTFNGKPYDDKISTGPAISMIESAVSSPADVYKLAAGQGNATKTVRDVASLLSLTLGIPASALARPVAYLTDINSGKAKPTGAADAARGAVTGAASPASKGR